MVRIVKDTVHRVVIEDGPRGMFIFAGAGFLFLLLLLAEGVRKADILLVVVALIMGGFLFGVFHQLYRHTRLTLHADGTADFLRRSLGGTTRRHFRPGELTAAVETERRIGHTTHRAVLHIQKGDTTEHLPLSQPTVFSYRAKISVNRIMLWHRDTA